MKKVFFSIVVAAMMLGCDDFLDLAPQSTTNAKNFYKTKADFNTAVIGAYQSFRSYAGMYIEMTNYRSDEMYIVSSTTGNLTRFEISRFREVPDNNIIANAWDNLYSGISRCNEIVSRLEPATIEEGAKAQYLAEAKFIRAFHYFNLVRFWGSVPLVLEPVTFSAALKVKRAEVSTTYAAIEDDLTFAAANLPAGYAAADAGRATRAAALALLAKVYLTQGKYAETRDALSDIVSMPLQGKVADVFDVTKKNNPEILFSVRYNKDIAGQGHGPWPLSVSDTSSQELSPRLLSTFKKKDSRRSLFWYRKEGNVYLVRKYYDTRSAINTSDYGNDLILLRQADVKLMYAEALNELGYSASGEAFTYLNDVHVRSGLPPFTPVSLPDQRVFRDSLLHERRLEFALEGCRWFDLLRTGRAMGAMQEEFQEIPVLKNDAPNIREYRLVYPVPQKEVQKVNDNSIFPQNDGYPAGR